MERPAEGALSFGALFGPRPDYPYFESLSSASLRPGSGGFEARTASLCADASLLSYLADAEFVAGRLREAGFPGHERIAGASTVVDVAVSETGLLVFFRGTEPGDAEDLRTDLGILLREDHLEGVRGRVHSGFLRALEAVWEPLRSRLGEGRPCTFAGHSLGGALAVLAAARAPRADAVYTFGAPRIGDRTFRDAFAPPAFRVVNNSDLVTRLPPPVLYRHVGELHYIDRHGRFRGRPSLWERIRDGIGGQGARSVEAFRRWVAGDRSAIAWDALVDHSPWHYARWTARLAGRQLR